MEKNSELNDLRLPKRSFFNKVVDISNKKALLFSQSRKDCDLDDGSTL